MFGVNMFVVLFFVLMFPFFVAEVCKDAVPDCHAYVKDDLCTGSFQLYGAQACRKTCGHCNDSCVDEISNCSDYNTNTDICNSNYTWSFTHCKKFCGFCGVLGESCKESIFCVRIKGASCKENVCTCDAGFRPLANIECEEVFWKKCNTTHGCDGLQNAHCMVPSSPGTTLAPWTNTTSCLCKPGYVYIHENHSCDANCGNLKAPQNGSVNISEGTTFGSKANYSCDIGYTLYGSNTATCESTGNWSNHYVNCTINDCGDPRTPVNGTADKPNGTKYQAVITYKCDTGFDLLGIAAAVCQANGKWSHGPPMCIIRDCGNPKIPENGTSVSRNGTKYQAVITYECDTGFDLLGNEIVVCQADGKWIHDTPTCKIKAKN